MAKQKVATVVKAPKKVAVKKTAVKPIEKKEKIVTAEFKKVIKNLLPEVKWTADAKKLLLAWCEGAATKIAKQAEKIVARAKKENISAAEVKKAVKEVFKQQQLK